MTPRSFLVFHVLAQRVLWSLWLLISPVVANADFAVGQRGVFEYPHIGGVTVDWCVSWGTNCGQAAADNFCKTQGYQRSIGYLTYAPGRTNVAGAICEGPYCGGFSRVECDQGVPGLGGGAGQSGSGGTTLICQFTQGPLAGRIIDYSGQAGATPAVIGQRCTDGGASSGIAIAAGSAGAGSATSANNNSSGPPVVPASAPRTGSGVQQNVNTSGHYPFPQVNGVAIDGCARYAEDCGQGGADQFCRTQGFASASRWNWAYDQRTWIIGSNRYCETGAGVTCGGLRDVVCTGLAAGNTSATLPASANSGSPAADAAQANAQSGPMAGQFVSTDFGNVRISGGPKEYRGEYEISGRKGTFNVTHAPDRGTNVFYGGWQGGGDSGSLSLTLQDDGNVYGGWNLHNQSGVGGGNVWKRVR